MTPRTPADTEFQKSLFAVAEEFLAAHGFTASVSQTLELANLMADLRNEARMQGIKIARESRQP